MRGVLRISLLRKMHDQDSLENTILDNSKGDPAGGDTEAAKKHSCHGPSGKCHLYH